MDGTEGGAPTSLRVIENADAFAWDDSADVVIVGYGGAGVCAALELEHEGASVIAIDRFYGGGATAFSGGVVYAADTPVQRQNGIDDDAANMERYLQLEVGDVVSPETLRRFCLDSAANLAWLEDHGVKFGTTLYTGKTTYPPEGYFLQYSGNEKVEEYCRHARPAPRGHRVYGRGFTGNNLYAALRRSADTKNIKTLLHSPVRRLVADASGRIIGVEVLAMPESHHAPHQKLYDSFPPTKPFKEEKAEEANEAARKLEREHGQVRLIRARRGVILATGGYVYDLDLLDKHVPLLGKNFKTLMRLGSLGDDGSAERLTKGVDAGTARMSAMFVGRVQSPPAALLDGILVNKNGERFVNEAVYVGTLGQAIADQPDGQAWLIMTKKDIRKAMRQILTGGVDAFMRFGAPALLNLWFGGTKKARNAEQLAAKCGIEPAKLQRALTRYQQLVASKHDEDFSKLKEHLTPLGKGPFVAMNVSLQNKYSFLTLMTLGGLTVDEATGAVKRVDGSLVPGLYAAGRAAVGIPSYKYISGLSLADCVFSGRRAAQACISNQED